MKWSTPSTRVQNILIAPIGIPIAIVLFPAILVAWTTETLIQKYRGWRQSKGWHRWFAWHPVYCGDFWCLDETPQKWVWLETVYRHQWWHGDTEYRWVHQVPDGDGEPDWQETNYV